MKRLLVWSALLALLAAPAGASAGPTLEPEAATEASVQDEESDPLFDEFADDDLFPPEVYDPFEGTNRAVYRFNQAASRWVWDPITRAYRFVVPAPARRSVYRVLQNLNTPIYVANHLLQLRFLDAAETLGAFAMNMTFGVVGLFDTAEGVNLALVEADFGQTLGNMGVGPGPYLVFPLMGPTNLRDGMGFIVDRAFHPATWFLGVPTQLVGYSGIGFAERESVHDHLHALEESALDPYSALRSAFSQNRAQMIAEAGL